MNRNQKTYLLLLILVIGWLVFLQVNKKPSVNWHRSYEVSSKSPFGLFVFNQEADAVFEHHLQRIGESPYQFYQQKRKPQNILIIERFLDKPSWDKILSAVKEGSNLMLISDSYGNGLPDSLRVQVVITDTDFKNQKKINTLSFTDPERTARITLDRLPSNTGFARVKKQDVEILGKMSSSPKDKGIADFIKIKFGKGFIYYHADPLFLTNYYLLKPGNQRYAEDVFSYLPNDLQTVWFLRKQEIESYSPLRFILSKPPLRYAWYVFLFGMLIFIAFKAKRKQRIVPIIEPLKNTSVEFVRNIGNLYLNEGNVRDMMKKKINYFLNKVRTELLIDTSHLDENFVKRLQVKTNKPIGEIQEVVNWIRQVQEDQIADSEENLIKLNGLLDEVYK